MGDTIRGYGSLTIGSDRLTFSESRYNNWGFGGAAQFGMDLRLNQDHVRGLFSAELDGFIHVDPDGEIWWGMAPLAGIGLESQVLIPKFMVGPVFNHHQIGVLGRGELGIQVGPRVAILLGIGFAHLPDASRHTILRADGTPSSVDQDINIMRLSGGLRVYFGYPNP